jgi:outer membrane protein W
VKSLVSSVLLVAATTLSGTAAYAQSDPLPQGRGMVWGSLGFQGDLGGSVNSSGVGVVSARRAEIDANTWGERYDAALIFRVGGAYNLTPRSQVFADVTWEQSEADTAEAGLLGGQPLLVKFSDYQGTAFDVGYRYFFGADANVKPFVGAAFGYQRLQDITISLESTGFNVVDVPFYDDSWAFGFRVGTGVLVDINERLGWHVTVDLKYAGGLADQSGIGTVGFERINDVGDRWTVPILGGVHVKF